MEETETVEQSYLQVDTWRDENEERERKRGNEQDGFYCV